MADDSKYLIDTLGGKDAPGSSEKETTDSASSSKDPSTPSGSGRLVLDPGLLLHLAKEPPPELSKAFMNFMEVLSQHPGFMNENEEETLSRVLSSLTQTQQALLVAFLVQLLKQGIPASTEQENSSDSSEETQENAH